MIAVLLAGFARYQLEAIPRIFPQDADVFAGDKTAGNESDSEQVANPLRIFGIVLVSFDSLNPFGVCDGNINGILQKVKHGNPIFPGRFHADVPAVVIQQPRLERKDLAVECGESPLLVFGLYALRGDECCDEKSFVNVHAATNWIDNSQENSLLLKIGEGKALTESPHI